MLRPIVTPANYLFANSSGKDLYLVRATFGDDVVDCVSFAISVEYRRSGTLVTTASDVWEIAAAVDKTITIFQRTNNRTPSSSSPVVVNPKGVGHIYIYIDDNEDASLICWKDELDRHVPVSNAFVNRDLQLRWK